MRVVDATQIQFVLIAKNDPAKDILLRCSVCNFSGRTGKLTVSTTSIVQYAKAKYVGIALKKEASS